MICPTSLWMASSPYCGTESPVLSCGQVSPHFCLTSMHVAMSYSGCNIIKVQIETTTEWDFHSGLKRESDASGAVSAAWHTNLGLHSSLRSCSSMPLQYSPSMAGRARTAILLTAIGLKMPHTAARYPSTQP